MARFCEANWILSDLWKAFVYNPDGGYDPATDDKTFLLTGVTRRFTQPTAPYEDGDLFLSLNAPQWIQDIAEEVARWDHQTQDTWHLLWTRVGVPRLQGADGIYLAGDWTRFIGHADAMMSGVAAGCNVGARVDHSAPKYCSGLPFSSSNNCSMFTANDLDTDGANTTAGSTFNPPGNNSLTCWPYTSMGAYQGLCTERELFEIMSREVCDLASFETMVEDV